MKVLVTGVTGNVGWGIARALLTQGHHVVAATRSLERAQDLAVGIASAGKLDFVEVDFSASDSVAQFQQMIQAADPVEHAVVSLGAWWQKGAFVKQDAPEYAAVRTMLLDSQVHAAQAILPALERVKDGSYTIITGAGALSYIQGTSMLYVAMRGVLALSEVLRKEHENGSARVNEIMIKTRIEREARPGVVRAEDFGNAVVSYLNSRIRSQVLDYDGSAIAVRDQR
jgi:NAD(P)-dependent dehydrogenase (short-subunit alcohol dehydrogenase family)